MPYTHNNRTTRVALAVFVLGAMLLQGIFPYFVYAEDTGLPIDDTGAIAQSGDAIAASEITNVVNSTETETNPPIEETDLEADPQEDMAGTGDKNDTTELINGEAGGVGDPEILTTPTITPEDQPAITITASNTASTTVNATTSAESGSATASGGSATAVSGDAVAVIDVLNVINTNITDSDGLIDFINDTLGYKDFDLRSDFEEIFIPSETAQSTTACGLDACGNSTTIINNDATIENDLLVSAASGNTTATGDGALAISGDAYASANVINMVNTNITDSQYLLLVFNNFDDYAGDIILPNSSFFDQLFSGTAGVVPSNVTVHNEAAVQDTLAVESLSGEAVASGADTVALTGNSYTTGVSTNLINQNIIGGTSFSMLIRVHGTWSGSISGLPDGMTWRETPAGIELIYEGPGGSATAVDALTLNNNANITNNVRVYALSGDSEATGDDSLAVTGNTYADASIMNIANTNVISSNWTNLIFTIYGNWSGNLMFGQPDLWVGIQADSASEPIMPGSSVDYTFTIFNQGDSTAHGVTLEGLFNAGALTFGSGATTPGKTSWTIGDIPAGGTREVNYRATISSTIDRSVITGIPLQATVHATEHESDYDNNRDDITVYVGQHRTQGVSSGKTFPAHFDITKTASQKIALAGDTIHYTVTFFNRGGQLFDAMLVDSLTNESGEEVLAQSWPLGVIKNWETVTIEYDIKFNGEFSSGMYTNTAQLIGFHESKRERLQAAYESDKASVSVQYTRREGQVLGASTAQCQPYLNEYLSIGWANSSLEVVKLQSFLNQHENASLPETGFFGPQTEVAVRRFQQKYSMDILEPWGDATPTGFVYYTTQKKINEIACGGIMQFPLTKKQETEILITRSRWLETRWLGW